MRRRSIPTSARPVRREGGLKTMNPPYPYPHVVAPWERLLDLYGSIQGDRTKPFRRGSAIRRRSAPGRGPSAGQDVQGEGLAADAPGQFPAPVSPGSVRAGLGGEVAGLGEELDGLAPLGCAAHVRGGGVEGSGAVGLEEVGGDDARPGPRGRAQLLDDELDEPLSAGQGECRAAMRGGDPGLVDRVAVGDAATSGDRQREDQGWHDREST